jgi:hypothetical protein
VTAFVPKNAAPRDTRELYHWVHKQLRGAGEAAESKTATASSTVPSSPTDAGTPGSIAFDATHLYICIADDTWKRTGISSW